MSFYEHRFRKIFLTRIVASDVHERAPLLQALGRHCRSEQEAAEMAGQVRQTPAR